MYAALNTANLVNIHNPKLFVQSNSGLECIASNILSIT